MKYEEEKRNYPETRRTVFYTKNEFKTERDKDVSIQEKPLNHIKFDAAKARDRCRTPSGCLCSPFQTGNEHRSRCIHMPESCPRPGSRTIRKAFATVARRGMIRPSRTEMCVDTLQPFCYSTRLAICAGIARWGVSNPSGSVWRESDGDGTICEARAQTNAAERRSKLDGRSSGERMKDPRRIAIVAVCTAAVLFVGCGGSSQQISITLVTPSGVLSVDESQPTAVPPIVPTLSFTAAVGGDTKNQGVTWPTQSNNLLTGSSCSGWGTGTGQCGTVTSTSAFTATYTPPSNLSASETITLKVESITEPSVTKTASITVVLPPTFTVTSCNPPSPPAGSPCVLPEGKNGVPYISSGSNQVTIAFTGGVSPYQVTISSYASALTLPQLCLGLTTSTTSTSAAITGTPCNFGTTTFTVQVVDSGGTPAVPQLYSITIDPPPPLSVTTTSLPPGFTNFQYSQAVTAQGGVTPLTWTMTPPPATSLPPGLSFNTATGLISGVPEGQDATGSSCSPVVAGKYCFSVQVTDSALIPPNSTHQVAPPSPLPLSITIQVPPPLQITTASLQGGTTATGYSQSLQATGGVTPYTWSVIQGQLPAGLTLTTQGDSTGSVSGTPILAGDSTFTVQVTDSEVVPQTKTAVFTITVAANNSSPTVNDALLDGSYVFLFNGFDKNGSAIVVGTITADGKGNITAGTEDSNRNSGVATGASVTGTYSLGTDGRGTMELTSVFQKQAPLTVDYHLVLDSSGGARFFEDNSTKTSTDILQTHGEGIMKPVEGSGFGPTSFAGNYAFVFPGQDLNGKPAALGGVVHANGSSLLTPGTSDFNDAGTFSSGSLSGDFSFIAGNRGAASMTFPLPSGQTTLSFVFHFISPSDLFFVEVDSSQNTLLPTLDRLGGEMILQNPETVFNNTVLAGASVASGIGLSGSNSDVFAGLLTVTTCDGSTPISLSYDENNGGTVTSPSSQGTCTMGLNGNGRASFSFTGFTAAQTRVAAAYLTGPGQGFVLGSDAAVTTGLLEQQSGGPFADSSVFGSYALSAPLIAETQVENVLGQAVGDGLGNIIEKDADGNTVSVVDEIDPPATSAPTLDQAFSAVLSGLAASGRGTFTPGAPVPKGLPASGFFYIVSPGDFRMISTDPSDQHPNLFFFNH